MRDSGHEFNYPRVRFSEVPEGLQTHLLEKRFEIVFASKCWLESTGNLSEVMSDCVKLIFGGEMYLHYLKNQVKGQKDTLMAFQEIGECDLS